MGILRMSSGILDIKALPAPGAADPFYNYFKSDTQSNEEDLELFEHHVDC